MIERVHFEGVTGTVDFYDASSDPNRRFHGDRAIQGLNFSILNFVNNTVGFAKVGWWVPCGLNTTTCALSARWIPNLSMSLTFSTQNNTRPVQTGTCASGEFLTNDGRCECTDGFELDPRGVTCRACMVGQDSRRSRRDAEGSGGCTLCAEHYYRIDPKLPSSACTPCNEALPGVMCGLNATLDTLMLMHGYWRHSAAALQTWRCKRSGSWSPCHGGVDAGNEGDGYCAAGYRGPRCELCNSTSDYSHYFDKHGARCHACGDVTAVVAAVTGVLFVVIIGVYSGGAARIWRYAGSRLPKARKKVTKRFRGMERLWRTTGMRYKFKLLVGLYQCVSMVPSAFNVAVPPSVEEYTRWMQFLEIPSKIGLELIIPDTCLGSYQSRLLICAFWPIVLVFVAAISSVCFEIAKDLRKQRNDDSFSKGERKDESFSKQKITKTDDDGASGSGSKGVDRFNSEKKDDDSFFHRTKHDVICTGLRRVLPLALVATFVLLPNTSARIFQTFACDPIEFDHASATTHRFLHNDLRLTCDSGEYDKTRDTAVALLILWPVAIPVLYALLLLASRRAILNSRPTELSRASAFLWGDFTRLAFWWEPIEMCRKLVLTGWVLLISGEHEQLRVLVALVVSFSYMTLHVAIKPLQRSEDSALLLMVDGALVLTYLCVLLIKSCSISVDMCVAYGLGESAEGVFLFVVFIGSALFVLLLVIGATKLWAEGYAPRILLVARAHSLSPWQIAKILLARRVQKMRRRVVHALHLDAQRLTARAAAAIYKFRFAHGQTPPAGLPPKLLPAVKGTMGELQIKDTFPRTVVFFQLDLENHLVRWSRTHVISMHTISGHQLSGGGKTRRKSWDRVFRPGTSPKNGDNGKPETNKRRRASRADFSNTPAITIMFSDVGGIEQMLVIRMLPAHASSWFKAIQEVLSAIPYCAAPTYWRWTLCCMAATSQRGAGGSLRRYELVSLLRFVNASTGFGEKKINNVLESAREDKQSSEHMLPWLGSASPTSGGKQQQQNAPQVMGLLLRLCISSSEIDQMFANYAGESSTIGSAQWLRFFREEQLTADDENYVDSELSKSEDAFENAVKNRTLAPPITDGPTEVDKGLSRLQFAQLLISPRNDAVALLEDLATTDYTWEEPFPHYWTACSHNSYIVGDQLTGRSSADAYRRQLLQQCRQLEVDCWDGRKEPVVTHGNTFCTKEPFDNVAKAIAECAFQASDLPVVLSLEAPQIPTQGL
mmetsp:Transcript_34887/g.96345  ORF Transcript_34887/g.96345 Transcript_34887/m.96345 type:complete len:1229 (-) Transcript_34887:3353-7039(-)